MSQSSVGDIFTFLLFDCLFCSGAIKLILFFFCVCVCFLGVQFCPGFKTWSHAGHLHSPGHTLKVTVITHILTLYEAAGDQSNRLLFLYSLFPSLFLFISYYPVDE